MYEKRKHKYEKRITEGEQMKYEKPKTTCENENKNIRQKTKNEKKRKNSKNEEWKMDNEKRYKKIKK